MHIRHTLLTTAFACAVSSAYGGTVLMPEPAAPSAGEVAEFEARKAFDNRVRQKLPQWIYSAGGHAVLEWTNDSGGGVVKNDVRSLPQGFVALPGEARSTADGSSATRKTGEFRAYQGLRSGVFTFYGDDDDSWNPGGSYGDETTDEQFPRAGKATYSGMAFDRQSQGTLTYHVDFGEKTGHGSIEGIAAYGTITLHAPAKMVAYDDELLGSTIFVEGSAEAAHGGQLTYNLHFFGNRAEEIAGFAFTDDEKNNVALHAARGAVTQ